MSQSSPRREMGWLRTLVNRIGESGSRALMWALMILASSGCSGCSPGRLPLTRWIMTRSFFKSKSVTCSRPTSEAAQAVAVGEQKQRPVAFIGDLKEAEEFVLG